MATPSFQSYWSKTQNAQAQILSGITLDGWSGLQDALARFNGDALAAAEGALYRVAEEIMTAAKKLTPVDTGNLRASGHVLKPEVQGSSITVTLGFGGPAGSGEGQNKDVGYAVPVHERLDLNHPVGQAKYLEQPMLEAARDLEARLRDQIMIGLGI